MSRIPKFSIALALALLTVGCATHHTVEPYRSDLAEAGKLEREAERICSEMRPGDPLPPRRFVTDGCTAVPDGAKVACCVAHDITYWCGGTRNQRRESDARFGRCVAETQSPFLGRLLGTGVRVTGHPWFPAGWRWGFGHPYSDGYTKPTNASPPTP
jgi:hypothetical protein